MPFIAVSPGQKWCSQEELLVKAELCIQGCWNPETVKQVPKSAFSPAGFSVSSDWRSWWMWVTTFPACEEPGTCSLHSQQMIFARFLCRICPFLYFVTHWHLESGEGNLTTKNLSLLYCLLPFCWQSKAVRNNFSSSPGSEIVLQALSAISPCQGVDSGNRGSILNVSEHGITLVMDTWDKNVGMDANLAGLTLKKSTADDW